MRSKITPEIRSAIIDLIKNHPELNYKQIAEQVHVCEWTVGNIATQEKINRRRGAGSRCFWKGAR